MLLFTALFIAYFFPPRLAWPLVALFCAAFFSPLLYDPQVAELGYPARCVLFLSPSRARPSRCTTSSTACCRRRPSSAAWPSATRSRACTTGAASTTRWRARPRGGPAALVLFDFDDFKAINDDHGHPTGDAVLHAVAQACTQVVRDGDCLARIGGDEFASSRRARRGRACSGSSTPWVPPRRGPSPDGVPSVQATFAWAVAPEDTTDPAELFRLADQRLLARKREAKRLTRAA